MRRVHIYIVPKEFGSLLVCCLGWVVPVGVSEGLKSTTENKDIERRFVKTLYAHVVGYFFM